MFGFVLGFILIDCFNWKLHDLDRFYEQIALKIYCELTMINYHQFANS